MTLIQNLGAKVVADISAQSTRSSGPAAAVPIPSSEAVAGTHYRNIETRLDPASKTFWCYVRPQGKPIVSRAVLSDVARVQAWLESSFGTARALGDVPFSYFVFASRTPGVFNLGGDLDHFAECARAGDRAAIRSYAHTCVEVVHRNACAFDLPVVTMALVQGDALGGGFEWALSFDMIVAERSAKMGLPEILFNLFPGMGAYSFLSRRLDPARAKRMIMSGRIYTAEQLHEMGLVDVLAEDGEGQAAVARYIAENAPRHSAHLAIYRARRRVNPVTLDELRDVVDIWTDAVLCLTEADLRKMARLTSMQQKRLSRMASASEAAE